MVDDNERIGSHTCNREECEARFPLTSGEPTCPYCRRAAGLTWKPFDANGYYWGSPFPEECVADCSASGAVDEAVEYWRVTLGFSVPRDQAIAWLREFGAWPMESDKCDVGLLDTDDDTLARRVLWLACCDEAENGEPWIGLIH